jgi:tRNA(Arg) A34 adenosine deaminase TadA
MCASAIRWAGFREYIYGSTINHLVQVGWGQITIPSQYIVEQSWILGTGVTVMGSVGTDFTDPLFEWQYQESVGCPAGCGRTNSTGGTTTCSVVP